jgi:NDP-sugar pyrophosphorylase family protein
MSQPYQTVEATVAILAGGLATRMRPITEKIPKALIEVAGRPFICRLLKFLRHQGISRVVLCTGYLGEQIEAAVGNGEEFGVDVRYSPDGPRLLGTGGALRMALSLLGERFFVLNGDTFLPCDFSEVERDFIGSGKPALMAVSRHGDPLAKSNVVFRDGRIIEYNKRSSRPNMEHIDAGLGVLTSAVLSDYEPGRPFDLAELYHRLSLSDNLAGYECERFYEIGTHDGLKEAEAYFLEQASI